AGAIVISTEGGSCELASARQVQKNSKFLTVVVGNLDSTHLKVSPPTGPGTFSVITLGTMLPSTSGVALVSFTKDDAACKAVGTPTRGTSGTVPLASVSDGAYAGSGDAPLDSGDHIHFEFNSTRCPAIADIVNNPDTTPTTCL